MKLVDAEQLFCCDCEYKERCKNVTCDVKTMPTISAVPVVRCRNCKNLCVGGVWFGDARWGCKILEVSVDLDFFCGFGQRKEGDHDKHPSDPV